MRRCNGSTPTLRGQDFMIRSAMSALAALTCATALTWVPPIPAAHAVTALIMGGTEQPDPATIPHFMADTERLYLDPVSACKVESCQLEATVTPEQFWPFFTGPLPFDRSVAEGVTDLNGSLVNHLVSDPDEAIVISGSSQSSTVATIEKRNLAEASDEIKSHLQFVLTANPNRPNGGVLSRFTGLSVPFIEFTANGPTPTDTGIATTDIAFQYDIAADFPRYPLNVFALLNTLAGIDIHGSYVLSRDGYTEAELAEAIADPANRQTFGDTTYITIPTKNLPLVQPLRNWGIATGNTAITTPLADLIEPTLRVLVELGYDRSIGYGTPAPAGLFPTVDPVKLTTDLATAANKGVKDALADINPPAAAPAAPSLRIAAPKTKRPKALAAAAAGHRMTAKAPAEHRPSSGPHHPKA
jgi:hypothetical protein